MHPIIVIAAAIAWLRLRRDRLVGWKRGLRVRLARQGAIGALRSAIARPDLTRALAVTFAGADGSTDVADKTDELRGNLVKRLAEMQGQKDVNGEDKQEIERREKELGEFVDQLRDYAVETESSAVTEFKAKMDDEIKRLEDELSAVSRAPAANPSGATEPIDPEASAKSRYDGNYFLALKEAVKNHAVADQVRAYEEKFRSPEQIKVWAETNVEAAALVLPEVQEALPYLAAAAKIPAICREIRVSSPAIEFPVFASGLTVDVVPDATTKPASDPTWTLQTARVYTVAGTTQVPNPTLEDFPAARGWISSELGRATGVKEDQLLLSGTGIGQPLGLFQNGAITARALGGNNAGGVGQQVIETLFRAGQDVRASGFVEPTDIVLHPRIWTDVILSFAANIGYLYGPPQTEGTSDSGPPLNQPPARLLGLPVTQDAYVPQTLGGGGNEVGAIVGNFQDAIVLRRSPFAVDVDTSLGFRDNTTWFRGEERMGFIVVRPASFKKVSGVVPSA